MSRWIDRRIMALELNILIHIKRKSNASNKGGETQANDAQEQDKKQCAESKMALK